MALRRGYSLNSFLYPLCFLTAQIYICPVATMLKRKAMDHWLKK